MMHRMAARVAICRRGVLARAALRYLIWRMHRYPTAAEPVLLVMDTARDPRVSARAGIELERAWAGGRRGEISTAISMRVLPTPPYAATTELRRILHAHLTGDREECARLDPTGRVAERHLRLGYLASRKPEQRRAIASYLGFGRRTHWNVDQERLRELARRRDVGSWLTAGSGLGGGATPSRPRGVSGSDHGGGHASTGSGGSF